jgi:hypothetical protein
VKVKSKTKKTEEKGKRPLKKEDKVEENEVS